MRLADLTWADLIAAVLGAIGGAGACRGWERWRRNGKTSTDARSIIEAIREHDRNETVKGERMAEKIVNAVRAEGTQGRAVTHEVVTAVQQLRVEVAQQATPPQVR